MEPLNKYIHEYRKQMKKGNIQKAYRGLMAYLMDLRTHFSRKYHDFVPGSMYHGYMDMSYFPIFPNLLKKRKLKIAVVLIHDTIRFEVWLVGYNKQIQTKYWKLFKENDWNKYHTPSTMKDADYIIEYTLTDNPDFSDLDSLTTLIEKKTMNFVKDIEVFLSKHE